MKIVWKVISRTLLALGLVVYIAVALANYSIVQSYIGTVVGNYFSREWGGEVRIGSLHAMPFDHLILDHILWVSPTNDTIARSETIRVSFNRFPFRGHGLDMDRVYLKNTYYHLDVRNHQINLKFMIDYFKSNKPDTDTTKAPPFTVKANSLEMDNVHYKMELNDNRETVYPYGVQIPQMEFLNINAKMKNIKVVNDNVNCRIVRFSTTEKSGFRLEDMSGQVHVSHDSIIARDFKVVTPQSLIMMDAEMRYEGWEGMSDYLSSVYHSAVLKEGTHVAMSDVAYWAPVLWGVKANVAVDGWAKGPIDSLAMDLTTRWGDESMAIVAGSVRGLPVIDTTVFDLNIEQLRTTLKDMTPLTAKLGMGPGLEEIFNEIDHVSLSATVKGGIKEAGTVNLEADCGLGPLRSDVTLHHVPEGYKFTVDAESDGMGLSLLRSQWLTRTGFDMSVSGEWQAEKNERRVWNWVKGLGMKVDGHLKNTVVNGRRLSAANLSGELKHGKLSLAMMSNDSLADLDLSVYADLGDSVNQYDADLDIDNFDLGFLPHPLSTHLVISTRGNSMEEMSGWAKATQTRYGNLKVRRLALEVESDTTGKEIELLSDFADATVRGNFNYEEIPLMARHFAHLYLPEIFNHVQALDSASTASIADNTLTFQLTWNDDGQMLKNLVDNITIARGTIIDGSYNFGEQLKAVVRSDSLRLGPILLDDVGLSGRQKGDDYVVEVRSKTLSVGRVELLEDVDATVRSRSELGSLELAWGSEERPTRGDVMLELKGDSVEVTKPWFYVGEIPWMLSTEQMTLTDNGKLRMESNRIRIESSRQRIDAKLKLNGKPSDCVELNFTDFNLALLSDVFLQDSPLDVNGYIDGRFSLFGMNETPYFNANLKIDSCMVNRQPLDNVRITSNWNAELNMLNLQLGSDQVHALGTLGLGGEATDLNFNVDFNRFELALVAPLLTGVLNHFEGQLHGNFDISGTTSHPYILGEAYVENGSLGLDVTGVTYHFSDSLQFSNNVFTLNDFRLLDTLGNSASINGTIEQTNDRQLMLDLTLETDNLLVLDKKSGDDFYGTLLASANGRVSGPVDNLDIYVAARTNPGCEVTVPISYQQSVKSQNYIKFVSDEVEEVVQEEKKSEGLGFNIELDLGITQDVKLNLPMDFDEVSVNSNATGAGDLHMTLFKGGTPKIIGSYEITSGLMKVGLFSVYEKKFSIESGSSLNFQGEAQNARFDMKAVYSQRVNLSTLTGSLSTVDNTQKYLQVENVIAIAGTLRDPAIKFDIRLPNADQSVEEEVFAYIDRNSERDMLNQTLSLLINGNFYNVNNESQSTSSNPLGLVTSLVGSSLSDMVGFVDVNIDYRSATDQTNQQLDVNISKDWGRWYLESTLGYGGESRELEANTVNGAVIDALIGYRISPMFHLFAYNRTNTNDYTRIDLPYKQGVGLKLTKDFDRWIDLFIKKSKGKK